MAEDVSFKDTSLLRQRAIREQFSEFLKDGSLYQKHSFEILPDELAQVRPDMIHLYCPRCDRENPFKLPLWVRKYKKEGASFSDVAE